MATAEHRPRTAPVKGAPIDRRRLMTFACSWARQVAWSRRTGKPFQYLSEGLKAAWANERSIAAYEARRAAEARPVHLIAAELNDLENRDRLGVAGLVRLSLLHSELRAAA